MKKQILVSSIVGLSLLMCSCNMTESESQSSASVSQSTVQKETNSDSSSLTQSKSSISENKEEEKVNNSINNNITDEIRNLSNNPSGWGPGNDCDEKNRPNGAINYQNKYGKYDADFIAEDTNKIYLTFDEGYENGYTSKILDVLKEKNVKAVFFVTEPYAKSESELVKRMIAEGHVVGSHSVSHPDKGMPSLSLEQQRNEMQELHQYIKQNFNYDMYLFRYPCGIFSEQSLALMKQLGYKSVFWSFAYADWDPNNQPDETGALEKVTSKLHNGAIYLLHAVSKTNTDILGQFIDNARSKGFVFSKYN